MLEIYREIVDMINKGEGGVLATVVASKGSTPRKPGAKMLIKKGGTILGSIGGGGVEKLVIEKAEEVLRTGSPVTLNFDMSGSGRDAAMICGGQIDIFVEPVAPQETIYLFGAGHVSLATAAMGKMAGFRIVVVDPRQEYNNAERFPDVDMRVVKPFDKAFEELNIQPNDYVIIYTTSHITDEQCLAMASGTPARYLGMIGSKKKAIEVKQRLVKQGFSKEQLARVHSPVGLDIGAETPAEIAISVLAEIIHARHLIAPTAKVDRSY